MRSNKLFESVNMWIGIRKLRIAPKSCCRMKAKSKEVPKARVSPAKIDMVTRLSVLDP